MPSESLSAVAVTAASPSDVKHVKESLQIEVLTPKGWQAGWQRKAATPGRTGPTSRPSRFLWPEQAEESTR